MDGDDSGSSGGAQRRASDKVAIMTDSHRGGHASGSSGGGGGGGGNPAIGGTGSSDGLQTRWRLGHGGEPATSLVVTMVVVMSATQQRQSQHSHIWLCSQRWRWWQLG
jgi:hypothetical protein